MTKKLLKMPLGVAAGLFATALMATAQQGNVGRPGMVNYTEGQVLLDGSPIGSGALGEAEVAPGQTLETGQGRAEMLLTPGVFVRLGHESAVQMINPSLTDTQVALERGTAMVEVDQIADENHLQIHANPGLVAVYDGKAVVFDDGRGVEVKKGHELPLEAGLAFAKPKKFNRDQPSSLYNWSKLRSSYLAQANEASAQAIVANSPGWYAGTGWYWNPWYDTWAFVPGAGWIDSPFGFGYYSPGYWYYNVLPIYPYSHGHRVYRGRVPEGFHGIGPRVGRAARVEPQVPVMRAPVMRGGQGGHFGGVRR
jgi:FecR protein